MSSSAGVAEPHARGSSRSDRLLRLCSDDPFDDAQCAAPDAVSPETSAPVEVNTDAAPTGARAPVNSASNEVSAMIADLDRLFGQFKQKFDDMNKNLVDAMAPMFGPAEVAAATEEQKRAVFQGRPPSLRLLADRIRQGLCRRVVVLVGAGISTAAGIPDFRTPGSGLYDNLQKFDLPRAEAVFDIEYFKEKPDAFYCLARDLWPGAHRPTLTHRFLRLLADKGLLHAVYTQNIDGLERRAGVPPARLVECHGTFATARCVACTRAADPAAVRAAVMAGTRPLCAQPRGAEPGACGGLLKPDVVFFGESLPQGFGERSEADLGACDLLLVLGTSLAVMPFARLPQRVGPCVPRALFNNEVVGDFRPPSDASNYRDVVVQGACDAGVRRFCEALGWAKDLEAVEGQPQRAMPQPAAKPSGPRRAVAKGKPRRSGSVARK